MAGKKKPQLEVKELSVVPKEVVKIQEEERTSVEGLITTAIKNNVSVETMERLLVMRRELKAEQAKEAYDRALAYFQSVCPIIAKKKEVMNKDGRTVRYVYAPLDSIASQIRQPIKDSELSYRFEVPNKPDSVTAVAIVTHALGHSERSSFEVPVDKDSYMSAPQQYASALTFAKRYALLNALGILTGDEDDDAQSAGGKKDVEDILSVEETAKWSDLLESSQDLAELSINWAKIPAQAKLILKDLKDKLKGQYGN